MRRMARRIRSMRTDVPNEMLLNERDEQTIPRSCCLWLGGRRRTENIQFVSGILPPFQFSSEVPTASP